MTRLQSQLQRLYQLHPTASGLADQQALVRVMVLELARPADWDLLSRVWRGLQADLELPAPAVAVSGIDGFQLWFSLEQPVTVDHARAFLQALCARYLPDTDPGRLRLTPAASATTLEAPAGPSVPALQQRTGHWSAFVTADLAPIFADTPWVEDPPSDDGQAVVLSQLVSIKPPAFGTALERLGLSALQRDAPESTTPTRPADSTTARPGASHKCLDPKQFLLQVMNDERVALALRVKAAKALLPYREDHS